MKPVENKDDISFGEWLKRARLIRNLTQAELGKMVGVSKQHISNLERGEKSATDKTIMPSTELMKNLAVALNLSVFEVLTRAGIKITTGIPSDPKERTSSAQIIQPGLISEPPTLHSPTILQSEPELEPALLYFFRKLDADGKEEALAAVADVFHQRKKSKRPSYFDSQNPQTVPIIQEHELTPREREQADKLDEMERQRLAKRKERA